MSVQSRGKNHFLNKEESFMYDRETRYRMEDTMNAARIEYTEKGKVGCLLMRTYANNTVEVRFLSLLTQKELDRIFVFSTHPAHRDRVLDIRSW